MGKNSKFAINGDIGTAINAEKGAVVHIHIADKNKAESEKRNYAVHVLLKTCDELGFRDAMERISQKLFGTDRFKTLSVDDLLKLQAIADEYAAQQSAREVDYLNTVRKEHDEYKEFFRLTGIRAAKQERMALTKLIETFQLTTKQIKLAWDADVIVFENNQLRVKNVKWSVFFSWLLIVMCAILATLTLIKIYTLPYSPIGFFKSIGLEIVFAYCVYLCLLTSIVPADIGKKILRTQNNS